MAEAAVLQVSEPEAVLQTETGATEGADGDNVKVALDDPYKKAISYLEEHNIIQLFQVLTTGIVYERPEDPLDYMIEQVEKLQHEEKYHVKKVNVKET